MGFNRNKLNDKSDIEKIRLFFKTRHNEIQNQMIFPEISKSLDSLYTIFHHKELATRQRNSYQYTKNNLNSNDLLIVIDYKQKVYIFLIKF